MSLVWMFLWVLVVLGLAYWAARAIGRRGGRGPGKTGRMQVLRSLNLGRDQRVAVARIGERYLVLGITGQNISLLAELSPEEGRALAEEEEPGMSTAFKETLLEKLGRGKGPKKKPGGEAPPEQEENPSPEAGEEK